MPKQEKRPSMRADVAKGLLDVVSGRDRRQAKQWRRDQEQDMRTRPVRAYFDPQRTADH